MRGLISIADLTNEEIEEIFSLADSADKLRADRVGAGQIMATLFYEPSTRTRLSFESAMQRLGGSVISCSDMKASSTAKGETVADTAKVVSSYADVLVVRHYWDGAVQAMAEHADVPVINAGDGGHEHPTQTLCDLYTLRKEKGDLKGLTVVVCGDLKNGRTIHSLVYALARFGANVVTLAANGMELPQYVIERLEREYDYGFAPVASGRLEFRRYRNRRFIFNPEAAASVGTLHASGQGHPIPAEHHGDRPALRRFLHDAETKRADERRRRQRQLSDHRSGFSPGKAFSEYRGDASAAACR